MVNSFTETLVKSMLSSDLQKENQEPEIGVIHRTDGDGSSTEPGKVSGCNRVTSYAASPDSLNRHERRRELAYARISKRHKRR